MQKSLIMAQSHASRSKTRSDSPRRRERSYSPSRNQPTSRTPRVQEEFGYVIRMESDRGLVCSSDGKEVVQFKDLDVQHGSFKSLNFGDRVAFKRAFASCIKVAEPKRLLSIKDDAGNDFTIASANSYCEEDEYTRLARDIIFYTADNKFLVRKWGGQGHRARASHGNGFGTFIYRPPKNIPATANDVKFAKTMWEVDTKGWLLTFTIDGLGYKNNLLAKMFGEKHHKELLQSALTSEASCYVMPSKIQSNKASIAAPMTILVNFLQHDEISLKGFPDFAWQSLEQAIDPSCNVHAGVVAAFCRENGIASEELLQKYGWAPKDSLVKVELPEHLNTLEKWGSDPAIICTNMKPLLLQQANLPKPRSRRTCNPSGAVENQV